MPTPKITRFTAYDFTEQEMKSASVFNPLQKMWIQTQCAEIVQQLVNIEASEHDDLRAAETQRAFLKGQLASMEYLLSTSESMEINIREEDAASHSNDYVINQPPADGNIFGHSSQTNPPEGE